MIAPHGGRLVNRIAEAEEAVALLDQAKGLPKLLLNRRELSDLDMIATGAMSPLEGFMNREDYQSVVDFMRLKNGMVWSLPVTLSLKGGHNLNQIGQEVALCEPGGEPVAVMEVDDQFKVDKEQEADKVLQTTERAHPGVQYLDTISDTYVGGKVKLFKRTKDPAFEKWALDPKETRVLFKTKGWKSIVAFQTRNPIHRAHEYLQKCAIEMVDALLIHPLVGETKKDDIPAEVRMKCYEVLIENYYAKNRAAISVFPAAMRYAGPREAVWHALCRKNYGCTHFIVGRDHAGVGNYYGPFDAHYIFSEFDPEEIAITPLFFDNSFWCKKCGGMASSKTCPHSGDDHISLSGTKVREMFAKGEIPPEEFTRPEVAKVLIEYYQSLGKRGDQD